MNHKHVCLLLTIFLTFEHYYSFRITPTKWLEPIQTKHGELVKLFCRNRVIQYDIEIRDITYLNRKLTTTLNTLEKICKSIEPDNICTFTIDEIKFLSTALANKNRYIKDIDTKNRKFRAANEFEDIIQKTITIADESYGELRHNLDALQSLINQMGKSQNKILEHLDYVNFNALAQITVLNLKTFSRMYDSIMDIFINGNYEKIIDLVQMETMKNDLKTIQESAKKRIM